MITKVYFGRGEQDKIYFLTRAREADKAGDFTSYLIMEHGTREPAETNVTMDALN